MQNYILRNELCHFIKYLKLRQHNVENLED